MCRQTPKVCHSETSSQTCRGRRDPFSGEMSVNLRLSGNTDCHTSDIGHWFAMTRTDFVDSLELP